MSGHRKTQYDHACSRHTVRRCDTVWLPSDTVCCAPIDKCGDDDSALRSVAQTKQKTPFLEAVHSTVRDAIVWLYKSEGRPAAFEVQQVGRGAPTVLMNGSKRELKKSMLLLLSQSTNHFLKTGVGPSTIHPLPGQHRTAWLCCCDAAIGLNYNIPSGS